MPYVFDEEERKTVIKWAEGHRLPVDANDVKEPSEFVVLVWGTPYSMRIRMEQVCEDILRRRVDLRVECCVGKQVFEAWCSKRDAGPVPSMDAILGKIAKGEYNSECQSVSIVGMSLISRKDEEEA